MLIIYLYNRWICGFLNKTARLCSLNLVDALLGARDISAERMQISSVCEMTNLEHKPGMRAQQKHSAGAVCLRSAFNGKGMYEDWDQFWPNRTLQGSRETSAQMTVRAGSHSHTTLLLYTGANVVIWGCQLHRALGQKPSPGIQPDTCLTNPTGQELTSSSLKPAWC